MIDQIEIHPTLTQIPLRTYLKKQEIAVQDWSPLGQGKILQTPLLIEMGNKYNKSAAQIILRWHLQNQIIVIPKSVHKQRIKENIDIFDFELTETEMQQINQFTSVA